MAGQAIFVIQYKTDYYKDRFQVDALFTIELLKTIYTVVTMLAATAS